jgi:hypothetical protein
LDAFHPTIPHDKSASTKYEIGGLVVPFIISNKRKEKARVHPTDKAEEGERNITKDPTDNPGPITTISAAKHGIQNLFDIEADHEYAIVAPIIMATSGSSLVKTTNDSISSEVVMEPTHAYANQ